MALLLSEYIKSENKGDIGQNTIVGIQIWEFVLD